MHIDPKVRITQVANGYIVDLNPDEKPAKNELIAMIPGIAKQVLGAMTRAEDPVMANIEEEDEEQSSVHIFKTWKEVAGFLQLHFEK